MPPFEYVATEDDLAVLSAYVDAQEAAEAVRKSQEQMSQPTAAESSDLPETTAVSQESPSEDDDHSTAAPAVRRTHTWLPRLRTVDGVPGDRLAPIHGRLIAHGLLKFQLQGREDGLVYRVSSAGRQALAAPTVESDAA